MVLITTTFRSWLAAVYWTLVSLDRASVGRQRLRLQGADHLLMNSRILRSGASDTLILPSRGWFSSSTKKMAEETDSAPMIRDFFIVRGLGGFVVQGLLLGLPTGTQRGSFPA